MNVCLCCKDPSQTVVVIKGKEAHFCLECIGELRNGELGPPPPYRLGRCGHRYPDDPSPGQENAIRAMEGE